MERGESETWGFRDLYALWVPSGPSRSAVHCSLLAARSRSAIIAILSDFEQISLEPLTERNSASNMTRTRPRVFVVLRMDP